MDRYQKMLAFNQNNKEIYVIHQNLEKVGYSITEKLDVKNDKPNDIYLSALYLRSMDTFCSISTLIKAGLYKDSVTLLRSLFETLVYSKATSNLPNFVEISQKAYFTQKKSTINTIKSSSNPNVKAMLTKDLISTIDEEIKQNIGAENFKINLNEYCLKKEINMEAEYIYIYRLSSDEAHPGYKSAHDYMIFEDSLVKKFIFSNPEEIGNRCLRLSIFLIGQIIENLLKHFNVKSIEFDDINTQIDKTVFTKKLIDNSD